MNKASKIYIAGHRGLAGSAITRRLRSRGFTNLLTRTHAELDLERESDVESFFAAEKPEYVFLAAARVGGIHANSTYPVDFLLANLRVQNNVIESSWRHNVKGLLFLGSSCIYPRLAPQPLKEEYLLTGPLEPTNEPYAVAKIAGIKLCEAFNRQYGTRFLSVMPTNLYGPNDNYDLETSHVLPALIRKFHLAKLAARGEWETVSRDERIHGRIPDDFKLHLQAGCSASPSPTVLLWGTGTPRRELLYSDDLADACIFLMQRLDSVLSTFAPSPAGTLVNIGSGQDDTIRNIAETVRATVGFTGPIAWDPTKPDGTPRKLLDTTRLTTLGWRAATPLEDGIKKTYAAYRAKLEP